MHRVLAFIGGSGVYDAGALEGMETHMVDTAWGSPSSPIVSGQMNGIDVLFLARHGAGHTIPPTNINYRANIDALKQLGATDVIGVSAVGSLKEELPPGHFVLVDQFVDRTTERIKTFFGKGCVAHVSLADPVCPALMARLGEALTALDIPYTAGGTYLAMEGPQFSTRAESQLYRGWGCDVIGMTNMPEARLAREAELPYATVAMVTDYDSWREHEAGVDVAQVLEVMHRNAANAKRLIAAVTERLGPSREMSPIGAERALDYAIITAPEHRDPDLVRKLKVVAGRVLSQKPGEA